MRHLIITVGIAAALLSGSALAKDYFKWVDEQGVTRYAEQPPAGVQAEKVSTYGGSSTTYDPNAAVAATEEGKKEAEHKKEIEDRTKQLEKAEQEKCVKVGDQLKTLKERGRVRMRDKDGNERVLTPEEQAAKISELEKYITEVCEKKETKASQ
ncbi:MAG: DUF4124 domain-containing protein [Pseudomonadales bacterium]|nr:DUF4124 domain-containing protein [Pseudomonadales bacterium]